MSAAEFGQKLKKKQETLRQLVATEFWSHPTWWITSTRDRGGITHGGLTLLNSLNKESVVSLLVSM